MIERLDLIEQRYNEINNMLMDPSILCDINKSKTLSKELSDLEETVNKYHSYKKVISDLDDTREMLSDPSLCEMAREEVDNLENIKKTLENELQVLLIPKDKNDGKNVIIEIRGAAGGDEGNIFAGDLFDMYQHLATKEGWKIEIMESEAGAAGGYTLISFMVSGQNVYSKLKYESGSHRVQRVPVTETQGRIQTSTATVLVMPEPDPLDCTLNMDDVRIDITRSSGCGGQGVNTTDSAVRLTHIPTGIVVYSQTERSQIKNKEKGLKILETRLYDLKNRERDEKLGSERRSKIGTGDRSEKIRTYNYPQNRVTDHRISYTTNNLDRVMTGDIDKVIDALIAEDQARKLRGDDE